MLGDVHQGLLNKMHCSMKERTNQKHKRKLIKGFNKKIEREFLNGKEREIIIESEQLFHF